MAQASAFQTPASAGDKPAQDSWLREQFDRYFAAIGQGFNAYLERRSRLDRVRALSAKSDAELAKLGIKRDEIVSHVFRDLFYL